MLYPIKIKYSNARKNVEKTLHAINNVMIPTFWFWPNVDSGSDSTSKGIRSFKETYSPKHIHFFKNIEPQDFLRLLINSRCLIGNSSVGIRECAFMGVPVVNIGTRQIGSERGNNVIDVEYDKIQVPTEIQKWMNTPKPMSSKVYAGGDAGVQSATKLSEVKSKFHKTITY